MMKTNPDLNGPEVCVLVLRAPTHNAHLLRMLGAAFETRTGGHHYFSDHARAEGYPCLAFLWFCPERRAEVLAAIAYAERVSGEAEGVCEILHESKFAYPPKR